jgi:signal transduction histidine kinase
LLAKKIKGDGISKELTQEYLSKMEAELIRSTKLIRNLLNFARQSPPAFRQVNLNAVVNRAFELAAHSAELQHIQVIKELDPSLTDITADFDQLLQVCTNLILNAIQAMPEGGRLTLRTSVDNEQLKIEVQDTGHGISPENMRRLFTPFFTTKREVKGVGLGLAVAYGIVQRHKGKIEVQSKEGEGTTFTIYLPLHLEELKEKG